MNSFNRTLIAVLASLGLIATGSIAKAGNDFHDPPFDFLFGNHIDTHQETNMKLDKDTGNADNLFGKFYIIFTGEIDEASGLPIAHHPRGLSDDHDERCGVTVDCVTGWEMRGVPGAAKFLYHSGVNGNDHPVWMVNRAEEDSAPTSGMVIPQPGSYTHFHWVTSTSTDPRASSVSAACDKQRAGQLEDQAPTAANEVCQGWFLQIKAVRSFAFRHGGELSPVRPGIDNRTHLNLVTNYDDSPEATITHTRSSGGH